MVRVLINKETLIILNQFKVWIKDYLERCMSIVWGFVVFKTFSYTSVLKETECRAAFQF